MGLDNKPHAFNGVAKGGLTGSPLFFTHFTPGGRELWRFFQKRFFMLYYKQVERKDKNEHLLCRT